MFSHIQPNEGWSWLIQIPLRRISHLLWIYTLKLLRALALSTVHVWLSRTKIESLHVWLFTILWCKTLWAPQKKTSAGLLIVHQPFSRSKPLSWTLLNSPQTPLSLLLPSTAVRQTSHPVENGFGDHQAGDLAFRIDTGLQPLQQDHRNKLPRGAHLVVAVATWSDHPLNLLCQIHDLSN